MFLSFLNEFKNNFIFFKNKFLFFLKDLNYLVILDVLCVIVLLDILFILGLFTFLLKFIFISFNYLASLNFLVTIILLFIFSIKSIILNKLYGRSSFSSNKVSNLNLIYLNYLYIIYNRLNFKSNIGYLFNYLIYSFSFTTNFSYFAITLIISNFKSLY